MSKKQRKIRETLTMPPETSQRDNEDDFVMHDPPPPEVEGDYDPFTNDLLIILGTLAHRAGINAVAPTPEQLAGVQAHIQELGSDMDTETLASILRKAQVAVLRSQLLSA